MDQHTIEGDALNKYGEIADHSDCGDNNKGGCSGHMQYWENPHTLNERLLCEHHAEEADARQAAIQSEYLNDTVRDDDY